MPKLTPGRDIRDDLTRAQVLADVRLHLAARMKMRVLMVDEGVRFVCEETGMSHVLTSSEAWAMTGECHGDDPTPSVVVLNRIGRRLHEDVDHSEERF